MPNQKPGSIWKTARGTTPNSVPVECSGTNTPVSGDIVGINASGDYAFVADNAEATASIVGICMSDAGEGKIYSPGYTAAATGIPGVAAFGGIGSRAASMSPTRQRFVAPLSVEDQIVLTPSADTGVEGTAYALDRVGAGDYRVDIADTDSPTVRIVGFYEPDVRNGAAVRRVWVKFISLTPMQ